MLNYISFGEKILVMCISLFIVVMIWFVPMTIYSNINTTIIHEDKCTAAGGIHYKPSAHRALCFKPDSLIDIKRD
tara:strand:+ start:473 stop:697 length:225 start_codon:yes stop_codon:yes gene_type:complete